MVCRARLSWRSPPRLSRWRIVWPLEAGSGATPARRAKGASERTRARGDQLTISCAATIGPTPDSSRSCGTSARTWLMISRSSSFASAVATSIRRASERSASTDRQLVRGARVRAAEAAAASDQLSRRQLAQLVTEMLGCRDDHAAQLDERDATDVDGA